MKADLVHTQLVKRAVAISMDEQLSKAAELEGF
jgi:hypothetical protein